LNVLQTGRDSDSTVVNTVRLGWLEIRLPDDELAAPREAILWPNLTEIRRDLWIRLDARTTVVVMEPSRTTGGPL